MNLNLDGRTVLITGAASGIGRACATTMATEGAVLVLVDQDKDGVNDLAHRLPGLPGGPGHIAVTADLSTADGVESAMQQALAATSGVDVFISNAGQCRWRSRDQLTDADWAATFGLNFMASVRAVRLLLPAMRRRGRGSIVFTASDLAYQPEQAPADYQVSKVALISFMKSLALEAGPHIRVNAVAPGPVWTPLWSRPGGIADSLAEIHGCGRDEAVQRELALRNLPLGRIGQPAEVATVITFLASDAASFVTGATWPVDGGSIRSI